MSTDLIIRNLQHQLEQAATQAIKSWFENYLKHVMMGTRYFEHLV
jgi:hypothetical protein